MKKLFFVLLVLMITYGHAQDISAKSYIVMDLSGQVLSEKNADEPRSIASITKLVTVERALQLNPDEHITITKEDIRAAKSKRRSFLRAGMTFTRRELIELALVNSDNVAAIALGRTAENVELLLPPHMHIVESSGLDPENQSTARDLATYAVKLYNTNLAAISTKPTAEAGKIKVKNTNKMIGADGWNFYLSKTGYIRAAGSCLVAVTKMAGQVVAVVILGSSNGQQRWIDLYNIRFQIEGPANYARPVVAKKQRKTFKTARKSR